jgi:hypothetical protein
VSIESCASDRPEADSGRARFPAEELTTTVAEVLSSCTCAPPRHVAVLRSFGRASRQRAADVRRVLGQLPGVGIHDEPVPVVVHHLPLDHVCAYVDASSPASEARRLAALTRTPLIVINEGNADAPAAARVPILRLAHDGTTFPSAADRVVDVAFDQMQVRPNQPEHGELDLQIGEQPWRILPRGATVTAEVLPDVILVRAHDTGGYDTRWLTRRMSVRKREGLFLIARDGLQVADLDEIIHIAHEPFGLLERHV